MRCSEGRAFGLRGITERASTLTNRRKREAILGNKRKTVDTEAPKAEEEAEQQRQAEEAAKAEEEQRRQAEEAAAAATAAAEVVVATPEAPPPSIWKSRSYRNPGCQQPAP